MEQLKQVAPAALADVPVAFAYVFGSHATGTATARSDIDVAIAVASDAPADIDTLQLRFDVASRLERALGRGPVEAVVLDEAPLTLCGRVVRTGRPIASFDDVVRVRWASRTGRLYHDFALTETRVARAQLRGLAQGA